MARTIREEFSAAMRHVLLRHGKDGRPMSLRTVERKTAGVISHTSIKDWLSGKPPINPDHLRVFADAMKEPRTPLLDAAGYRAEASDFFWDRHHSTDADRRALQQVVESARNADEAAVGLRRFGDLIPGTLPYLGTVPAGYPEDRQEEEGETLHSVAGADYTLRVRGDSMVPYHADGEIVLVRVGEPLEIGRKYILLLDGESACKILENMEGGGDEVAYTFAPANSTYPRIRREGSQVAFQGRVIGRIALED